MRPLKLGLMACVCLQLAGCLPKTHTPLEWDASLFSRPKGPTPAIAALSTGTPGSFSPSRIELDLQGEGTMYRRLEFGFESSGDNRQPGNRVRGLYLESKTPGKRPLVVILPIWGSSMRPSRSLSKHLTHGERAGEINVLSLKGPETLVDWSKLKLAQSERAFRQELQRIVDVHRTTLADVRRVLRWAEERPEVDRERIGIVGFSMGAVVGSLVMGVDDAVWRGALVMGGGDPASILSTCAGRVKAVRQTIMRRFDWSARRFHEVVAGELVAMDPNNYAGRVDPRRVLYVEAQRDACIPESSRFSLWDALGRPERIQIDRGHRYSFLSMTRLDGHWMTRRLTEFFLRPEPVVGGEAVATSR